MNPSDLVLSIYPNSRGFGYVLFEGPLSPFDWGVKEIRGSAKNRQILRFLENLIDRHAPAVLVLEDWTDDAHQRIDRIVLLYEAIAALAKRKLVQIVRYPMRKIREHFAYRNALTKYEIALHIAKIIPAFSYQIPPERMIWRSEDARQGLYDAAAFGLAYYGAAIPGSHPERWCSRLARELFPKCSESIPRYRENVRGAANAIVLSLETVPDHKAGLA